MALRVNTKQFVKDALDLVGAKYSWGDEELTAVDCSGTLRYAFNQQGLVFDLTADGFLKQLFTEPCTRNDETNPKVLKAVFYVSDKEYDTPSGPRPAGVARHVTIVVGEYVVLHADYRKGLVLKTAKSVREMYEKLDCNALWRKLG